MSVARTLLPLCVAAILGLGSGCAESRTPAKRAPERVQLSPDDAFVQARNAAVRNEDARFAIAAEQAGGHPLSEYLDYWRLRLRLGLPGGRDTEGSDGSADAEIRRFIERRPGSLVADLLRRDWILDLGRRGEWALLDEQYAQWILRDDTSAHCRSWQGAAARGLPVPAEALETLRQPRAPGEACEALIATLVDRNLIGRQELGRLLRASIEANAAGSIRSIAALLGLPEEPVAHAIDRPEIALARYADPQVLAIAAARRARKDPDQAAGAVAALSLEPADRAFAMSQVAAAAMRSLSPRALEFTRQALDATVSDATLEWLARAALRDGDWQTLDAVLAKMTPAARAEPTWTYWQARAHQALGRPAEAEAALRSIAGRFEFYGQLAAEDLGTLTTIPPRAARPTEAELAEPANNPGFARALQFYALGLRFEGNREWNYQLRGMSDRQLLAAAEWACRRSVLDRCVNTADRTSQEHDFNLRFITPFADHLTPVALDRGLDPAWVYGLIRQESRFILDARSSANAQGLMQIIPSTARWIARKLGEKDFRLTDLNHIETNVRFGTFYLKNVLDDLDGSQVLATAGYNAGPNRPRNWRKTLPGTVEGAVFAEIIPFTETRTYVKNVMSNATFYAALATGKPQSIRARMGSISPSSAAGREDLP